MSAFYFPQFYDDELFCSAIGRYHVHRNSGSWARTQGELFGTETGRISVDLPGNLLAFEENVGHIVQLSADELAWKYTLFPFLAAYCSRERQEEVLNRMGRRVEGSASPYILLGMGRWRQDSPSYMRTCSECVARDITLKGETYFRRLFQLPGVFCCLDHQCVLSNTYHLYRSPGAASVAIAKPGDLAGPCLPNVTDEELEQLLDLAAYAKEVLNRQSCDVMSRSGTELRETVLGLGFRRGTQVAVARFEKEFRAFFGENVLQWLNLGNNEETKASIVGSLKASEGRDAPVPNMLLDLFLQNFQSIDSGRIRLKASHWRCQNPLAPHFGQPVVDRMTLTRRPQGPERYARFSCSCGFVFSASVDTPDGEGEPIIARRITYGPLYRDAVQSMARSGVSIEGIADALGIKPGAVEGLQKAESGDAIRAAKQPMVAPSEGASGEAGRPLERTQGVRYAHRASTHPYALTDDQLANEVRALAKDYFALPGKTPRLTKNYIGFCLHNRSLPALARSERCPKTARALADVCETREAFQIRRLRWAAETFPHLNRITPYYVAKRAGWYIEDLAPAAVTELDILIRERYEAAGWTWLGKNFIVPKSHPSCALNLT
jgi:hypothetical protein